MSGTTDNLNVPGNRRQHKPRPGQASELAPEQRERYSRQMRFAPIGEEGQARLLASRVAVVGMGALGAVLANHLVRSGVGFVRLIDRDFVEPSNLQRQMLYDEQDAAASLPKSAAAAAKLRVINSGVELEPIVADVNPANAEELLTDVDLILDGSDNFAVRFLVNDVSVKHHIPWVYGGVVGSRGVVLPIVPGDTPCLRCLFGGAPEPGEAETCDTAGVIGPIIHVVASLQAAEALKLLTGAVDKLQRKMTTIDLWYNHHAAVDVSASRQADCPCCGQLQFDYLEAAADQWVHSLCGRDSVQIAPSSPRRLSLDEWADKLGPLGPLERNPFLLKFKPDAARTLVLFPDGRVLVQGTDDPVVAKSLYARYIGM